MAIDPGTNCITRYEDAVVATLADCDSFLAFIGGAPTVPGTRIHVYDIPLPTVGLEYSPTEWSELHPYVLITPGTEGIEFRNDASMDGYSAGLSVELHFERSLKDSSTLQQELRSMANAVGDVMEEMQDKARGQGLNIDRMSPIEVPSAQKFTIGEDKYDFVLLWPWKLEYNVQ